MRSRGTCYSVTLSSIAGFRDAPPNTVAEWALDKAHTVEEYITSSFQRAYQGGVRIVLGTDAGTPFNRHGDNARELTQMVRLGMKPLDALRAGTRNGAELLGLDDAGVIEVGRVADLVVCAGDATSDVGLLGDRANIRYVVQAGSVVHE